MSECHEHITTVVDGLATPMHCGLVRTKAMSQCYKQMLQANLTYAINAWEGVI